MGEARKESVSLDNRKSTVRNTKAMKSMQEIMNCDTIPSNCLHLFQASTAQFGLDQDLLRGQRINFVFALKQRSDGKVNSHKWFY